ncbi:MAG: hypothetical protein HYU41_16615 [Candidatus Rokubacteria bacterium]|nr:hypothetical protein [Candidatus Rokubacteria bacterium]
MLIADHPRPLLAGTPTRLLVALALALAAAAAFAGAGALPPFVLGVTAIVAGHGALMTTALAWAGLPVTTCAATIVLVALGAVAAHAHPAGALAYLALPLWIHRLARSGRLGALGLDVPSPPGALLIGALVGLGLGGHLLVSATLTLGYRVGVEPQRYVGAILYDVGAQVLATELFFRGALFNRAQRRWPLGRALLLAVGATLVRYLVDPLLPRSADAVLGMTFYISLLAAASGWLFWRFGTPVPGMVAGLGFFAAYRALAR